MSGHADAVERVAFALWRRLDVPGHDACWLERIPAHGWSLAGHAVFRHDDGPASLAYQVLCDERWRALRGRVRGVVGGREVDVTIRSTSAGWLLDDEPIAALSPMLDLDYGFTPATNLVQLRRMQLAIGESRDLPAAWWDVGERSLTELPQRYERRRDREYWYEGPRFNYSGMLLVGDDGFADVYPGLWERER